MKYLNSLIFCLFPIALLAQTTIGLELYSFRNQIPKDVPGMLSAISKMGITELEGGGTYGLPIGEYKQLLDKNNLKMISIGADFDKLQKDLPADYCRSKGIRRPLRRLLLDTAYRW